MFELNSLIGEKLDFASKILEENGYNDIEVISNSSPKENCNAKLVCCVRKIKEKITLIVGEFVIKD